MANNETLFQILQFVALVAPAMAIFMQLLENSDEVDSPAFRFLEIGLLMVISGGAIILIQILLRIGNIATQLGVVLIFTSLIALAGGIGWRAIPATDDLELSVSSLDDVSSLSKQIIGRLGALSLPFIPPVLIFAFTEQYSFQIFRIGHVRDSAGVDMHIMITVVALIISFRSVLYLINIGYLTDYSIRDIWHESIVSTVAGYAVVGILIVPVFIIAHLFTSIPSEIININPNNLLFSFAYIWTVVVIVILYSIDMWAEKEGESRLATDDEE